MHFFRRGFLVCFCKACFTNPMPLIIGKYLLKTLFVNSYLNILSNKRLNIPYKTVEIDEAYLERKLAKRLR